jgi:integrase
LRGVRAYIAELREHSEWNAYSATKALKTWSRFLVADGLLESDPLASLPNLEQPETMNVPVAKLDDIQRIIDACDDTMEGCRDAALICLLRATGMRRGELIALRWSDVDFGTNTVHLRAETTKSGRARALGIDAATRTALRRYRRALDRRGLPAAVTCPRGTTSSGSPRAG